MTDPRNCASCSGDWASVPSSAGRTIGGSFVSGAGAAEEMVCRPITTRRPTASRTSTEIRFIAEHGTRCYPRKIVVSEPPSFLHRRAANHVPLSPLSFLARAADVHPDRLAVRYGAREYTYAALHRRSRQLAGALQGLGIRRGDVVAMMAANTPEIYEAHFGVPLAGAVLNTINTRLDADTIAVHPRPRRRARAPDRHAARARGGRGAAAAGPARPDGRRYHRRPGNGRRRASGRPHVRRAARRRTPRRAGGCRTTSGTRSRSTTRPAPAAGRRASSTTTAART